MAERKIDLLLRFARENSRATGLRESDPEALQKMFWKLWAHPDLIGLWLATDSVTQILSEAKLMWNDQPGLFGMGRWPFLLNWLDTNSSAIVSRTGIDNSTNNRAKNPMKYHGYQNDSVYSALCRNVLTKDEDSRRNYRLLQAHILIAFSVALQEQNTSERYKQLCHQDVDQSAYGSDVNREPLDKSCYLVGRALRQLDDNDPACAELLNSLPLNLLPVKFAKRIETTEFALRPGVSDQPVKDLRILRNFLKTVYGGGSKKVLSGMGGRAEGSWLRTLHGRTHDGPQVSLFQPPQSESAWHDGEQFQFFVDPLTEEERRALGYSDDESGQLTQLYSAKRPKSNVLQRASWKQNNRRIMANQVLSYDFDELNGSDLGRVWRYFGPWWKWFEQNGKTPLEGKAMDVLEKGALLWVMLWTASSVERAKDIHIAESPRRLGNSPLSLLISYSKNKREVRQWRLASLPPRAHIEIPAGSRPYTDHILLPDICDGSAWVIRLWRALGKPRVIFQKTAKQYHKIICRLFDDLRQTARIATPLTSARYSNVLFWRLLRRSGHDFSAVSMVIGQDHQLNSSRLHYTTRRVVDIQRLYLDCAQDLACEIAAAGNMIFERQKMALPNRRKFLGARHCPTVGTVKLAITELRNSFEKNGDMRQPKSHDERVAFVAAHDKLTLYTYWMFAFATGIRAIVDPYRRISPTDLKSGILNIDDKKANVGGVDYKNRLVWLPPVLRQQMVAYDNYLRDLKRICGVSSRHACFFLTLDGENLCPTAIRPAELQARVMKLLRFPVNTQRLFLRSELLQNGCGAEIVDAFLGHWYLGEEPWAPYSTFNYKVYFETLESHIEPLLRKIGFSVVPKRIVS